MLKHFFYHNEVILFPHQATSPVWSSAPSTTSRTPTISARLCRGHRPTVHATHSRAHRPAGKPPPCYAGEMWHWSKRPQNKSSQISFLFPWKQMGLFFFCWLLLVFHDCLKGWRTCIHPSCGDPQKDPEPMCSGNPGSVVVEKSRSCKHRGRSQSLSLHLLISWTSAIGFNNSLNLVNETS